MVDLARENRCHRLLQASKTCWQKSYYGLRLAQQVVAVREETYKGLQKHYENALKSGSCRNDRQCRTTVCPSEYG